MKSDIISYNLVYKKSISDIKLVVTALTCCVFFAAAMSIPHIYTTGTHYQVGFDIGSTFKDRIQEFFTKHPLLHSKFLPWVKNPYGERVLQGFIDITQLQYEWIMDEIRGISDGAGVDFLEVFILCYTMEFLRLIDKEAMKLEPDSCSDVHIHLPESKQIAIGHNEDTLDLVLHLGYFVTAHIIERDEKGVITHEEKFTHYSYPGILPGNAFGFNVHGIIQTVNALCPDTVLLNRTGRYILSRVLLGAKNLDDVKRMLYNEGYGAAYGVNLNIGVLPPAGKGLVPEIWDVEVAPNSAQNHSLLDVFNINSTYYHVNMYRRLKLAEVEEKIVSSLHRTARILAHPTPTKVEDILSILGDTDDKDYPIFRRPSPTDPQSTVATALFDLQRRTLTVYRDNPSNSTYGPVMTMPLDMS